MTSCQRVNERLGAYHDRELAGLARWRVERHLGGCAACRAELDGLRALGGLLREAAPAPASPDLWRSIEAQLVARERGTPAAPVFASAPSRPARFVVPHRVRWAAAAAAALLALWVVGGEQTPRPLNVVRSITVKGPDPVIVLPESNDSTVIWVNEPGDDTSPVQFEPVSAEGGSVAP